MYTEVRSYPCLGSDSLCLVYCGQCNELGTEATRSIQTGCSALAQRRYSKERLNNTPSGSVISNRRTSLRCDYTSGTCSTAKSESAKPSPRTSSRDSGLFQRMKRAGKQQWTHLEIVACREKQVSTLVRSRILSIWVLCFVIPANLLGVYPSSRYDVNVEDRGVSSPQLHLIVYHAYVDMGIAINLDCLLFVELRVWGRAVTC